MIAIILIVALGIGLAVAVAARMRFSTSRALRGAPVLQPRKVVHALIAERRSSGTHLLEHAHKADVRQIWIALPIPLLRMNGPLESWDDAPHTWRQLVGAA